MRLGRSVLNAFRHGVRFMPYDVGAEIPPIGLQRERNTPRDSDKVFGFESGGYTSAFLYGFFGVTDFRVMSDASTRFGGITVSQIQPQRPVIPQHPPHFPEHFDHLFDVFLRGLLQADLALRSIISKTPIWRRSNASMYKTLRR